MRIKSFEIRNFKNIKYAICDNVPDFVVICGSNGSGKSAILEALMTAKEAIGSYGGYFQKNPNATTANADKCSIVVRFGITESEMKSCLNGHQMAEFEKHLISEFTATITIEKLGHITMQTIPHYGYSGLFQTYHNSKGFFDYFNAHRVHHKSIIDSWKPNALNEDLMKRNLAGLDKGSSIKTYLSHLKMLDLQKVQAAQRSGIEYRTDSLQPIRTFFNSFFAPMQFDDVYIDRSPFSFVVRTPNGDIDIDDLSSGEKEILNTYIHFKQVNPRESIILFDEPDAHLHPELERRYLEVLKSFGDGNQFFITTHSPDMMIGASENSLYTVLKYQQVDEENQFVKVSGDEALHTALSDVMGATGFVSLNRKIVFVEGESSSTDVAFYKSIFTPSKYNVSFIAAGDSTMVRGISEKVMYLLDHGSSFQQFFCIIDGDIENRRLESNSKLFRLPVYHVENYLLDENIMFEVLKKFTGADCPFHFAEEVLEKLKEICLSDAHVLPFTKALLDSQVYQMTETAKDFIFQKRFDELSSLQEIRFDGIKDRAIEKITQALKRDTWKKVCKGRDIIKAFCRIYGLQYDHYRNNLIAEFKVPPESLLTLLSSMLND